MNLDKLIVLSISYLIPLFFLFGGASPFWVVAWVVFFGTIIFALYLNILEIWKRRRQHRRFTEPIVKIFVLLIPLVIGFAVASNGINCVRTTASPPHFRLNTFTGECSYADGTVGCQNKDPWYYESGCSGKSTKEMREAYERSSYFETAGAEIKLTCEQLCEASDETGDFCYSSYYGDVCPALIDCSGMLCK